VALAEPQLEGAGREVEAADDEVAEDVEDLAGEVHLERHARLVDACRGAADERAAAAR
jgi:hypothetical protein